MNEHKDYIHINKTSWNKKVAIHLESAFYDMDSFRKGKSSLKAIELNLLGDVSGKSILHLQCHFGQDSISLSRMGAEVTGVDFSDQAIAAARDLATQENANTEFICCNIYDLKEHLHKKFDIVFTSYGTIGWLPDLNKWGELIASFVKPGGHFVFVEFHPAVWMFDDDFTKISYDYFNSEAITETLSGTYADKEANITQQYVMWNHGMGEVVNSLIRSGLTLQSLEEFDYSPFDCFRHTECVGPDQYRIKHIEYKFPMVYAIKANK
jgi:2-polyprenyl-3-methyl-5-hydroxy-6-metoxy-1,4-benzoquinol methylase